MYAPGELGLATPGREREGETARVEAMLGEPGEAVRVVEGCFGAGDDACVTGEFALEGETAVGEEECGVEREERESELLREVNPVVAATKVLALVKNDLVEIVRG